MDNLDFNVRMPAAELVLIQFSVAEEVVRPYDADGLFSAKAI